MSINRNDRTFRLAFVRRKVRTTFKSQAVRTALLDEVNTRGPLRSYSKDESQHQGQL